MNSALSEKIAIKTKVKLSISEEIQRLWNNHIQKLVVQGEFLKVLQLEEDSITWRSIMFSLPRNILQFAVNSSIDTLATNTNLKRWGKRTSASCSLCGSKETLLHVLNNCSKMLDRYSWRHNSVLNVLINLIKPILPPTYKLSADIPGQMQGNSTIPHEVLITKLKPDIVVIDHTITLILSS